MAESWSQFEVDAVVSAYFDMLVKQLRGERFVKASHYRALASVLEERSQKSIEFKHANISAVLRDLDWPWIPGITPRSNYQHLLASVVAERVTGDRGLLAAVQLTADLPAVSSHVADYLIRLEDPPAAAETRNPPDQDLTDLFSRVRPQVDYAGREARNASLGVAGETFVVDYERARLAALGADALVERVEHVAVTLGDGLGFDVRSFGEDGSDMFIEVKTTSCGKGVPFFVSRNELRVSRRHPDEFHLYRVFDFRRDPRLYILQGPIDQKCELEPTQFSARVS